MRFLDTTTGRFVDGDPRHAEYGCYAILSHTWDRNGEQSFQDLKKIQERYTQTDSSADGRLSYCFYCRFSAQSNHIAPEFSIWDDPDLSPKIRDACKVARANGFNLIWIDSCCIDKSSSAELSEAINSMYAWYAAARVCYAYLVDVPRDDDHRAEGSQFRQSLWFKRGWTLQELIAPFKVTLLSQDWNVIGSKRDFVDLIEDITGISAGALLHEVSLDKFSVAQRLSWASKRVTTRVEDEAYSLLGIFDINMPTLYGEGERAFRRLQEEIMQHIPDQSLFVGWSRVYRDFQIDGTSTQHFSCMQNSSIASFFAQAPSSFEVANTIEAVPHHDVYRRLHLSGTLAPEYVSTPHGIRMQLPLLPLSHHFPLSSTQYRGSSPSEWYLAILGRESPALQPCCLLGRICYITSSESGIASLSCGMVQVHMGSGGSTWYNLFPLSPATLKRCRAKIKLRTVYITHPDRTNMTSQAATLWPHTDVHLSLPAKACDDLRGHGYTVDLRGPDEGHPQMHVLNLSGGDHGVAIEYHHNLTQEGRELTIHGSITASRLNFATWASETVSARPSSLVWSDMLPWEPELRWHEVTITISNGNDITIRLGVNLVWESHYSLDVQILDGAQGDAGYVQNNRHLSARLKAPFRRLRQAVALRESSVPKDKWILRLLPSPLLSLVPPSYH